MAIGIAGAVVAILAFILRMAASIGKKGRQVSWDDLTMFIVVLIAIPPAVFTHFCKTISTNLWPPFHLQRYSG